MTGGRRIDGVIFELPALLGALLRHGVRFVVIGGIAGNAHGSTTATLDLDICYARDGRNLDALAAALKEVKATLRGAEPGLPFRADARAIRNGLNFTFSTTFGDLDCLGDASGYTYESLAPNAERTVLGGTVLGGSDVLIASLDDLIRMKRAAGRIKDLVEVENLSKLREVREEHGLYRLTDRAPR
jgi:hypothetical protein